MVENTPVELVLGRKPRDIITLEHSPPEQVPVPVSPPDQTDQTLQKLALKYYRQARQIADLRRDIAACLFLGEGLCSPWRQSLLLAARQE